MKTNMLVSVIIPVFNVKPYLEEALDSVICQTYKNLEIIIIDDGSTDGSGAVCDKYAEKDDRIRIIHQDNKGLSAARNIGLEQMTGEAVAFFDPDDICCPKVIETLLEKMVSTDSDITVCDFYTVSMQEDIAAIESRDVMSVPEPIWEICNRETALQRVIDTTINYAPWNKLYKSQIWEKLRFPEGHVYEGTYTIFSIFELVERAAITNEKLIIHRERKGSITYTISVKNSKDWIEALKHYISYIEKNTPNIFSVEQLMRKRNFCFIEMTKSYLNGLQKKETEWKLHQNWLRSEMLTLGKAIENKHFTYKTRFLYIILRFFPFLFDPVCYLYRLIKK